MTARRTEDRGLAEEAFPCISGNPQHCSRGGGQEEVSPAAVTQSFQLPSSGAGAQPGGGRLEPRAGGCGDFTTKDTGTTPEVCKQWKWSPPVSTGTMLLSEPDHTASRPRSCTISENSEGAQGCQPFPRLSSTHFALPPRQHTHTHVHQTHTCTHITPHTLTHRHSHHTLTTHRCTGHRHTDTHTHTHTHGFREKQGKAEGVWEIEHLSQKTLPSEFTDR